MFTVSDFIKSSNDAASELNLSCISSWLNVISSLLIPHCWRCSEVLFCHSNSFEDPCVSNELQEIADLIYLVGD